MRFRSIEAVENTNRAMQGNLEVLQNIAFQNQKENETLATLAFQGQKDSKRLKTLTLIATMYLPVSLVAVRFTRSSSHSLILPRLYTNMNTSHMAR
jgi:hypothetical protein